MIRFRTAILMVMSRYCTAFPTLARFTLLLAAMVGWNGSAHGALIPPDRRIDWSPGVRGGIPDYPVYCDVKRAPYFAVGDGVADDSAAIQGAILACPEGQAVYLPEGTYFLASRLIIGKSIAVKGAGMGKTTLIGPGKQDVLAITRWTSTGTTNGLQGDQKKGSQAIQVDNAAGLRAGSVVVISQLNKPGLASNIGYGGFAETYLGDGQGKRVMTQINKIAGISNKTVLLERPLYIDLEQSLVPWMYTNGVVQKAGIEDMTVLMLPGALSGARTISLTYCSESWVKNVESISNKSGGIVLTRSFACEVRDCYVHDPQDVSSGKGYGIWIFGPNSDHLVENNIVVRARHSLIFEGGGSGCVYAYNFCTNATSMPDPTWLSGDMDTHGAHPYMNLFEGNLFQKLAFDNSHGSSSHNTAFRNYITLKSDGVIYGKYGIDVEVTNYFQNIVGNIVGEPGMDGVYNWTNMTSSKSYAAFRFGHLSPSSKDSIDAHVIETALIHFNYEYMSKSLNLLDGLGAVLPESLYRSVAPEYWGELRWPPFGPDMAPMVGVLPAQIRYWRIMNPLMPPTNMHIEGN